MAIRAIPDDLMHDLNAAQAVLNGVTAKAADEGYSLEIYADAHDEMRWRIALVRRVYAEEPQQRPAPRPVT